MAPGVDGGASTGGDAGLIPTPALPGAGCLPSTVTGTPWETIQLSRLCSDGGRPGPVVSVSGCPGWSVDGGVAIGPASSSPCSLEVQFGSEDGGVVVGQVAVSRNLQFRLIPSDLPNFNGPPKRELSLASASPDGTVWLVSARDHGFSYSFNRGITWTNATMASHGLTSNLVRWFQWQGDEVLISLNRGFVLGKDKLSSLTPYAAGRDLPDSFAYSLGFSATHVVGASDSTPPQLLVAQRTALNQWTATSLASFGNDLELRQWADVGGGTWLLATNKGLLASVDFGQTWVTRPNPGTNPNLLSVVSLGGQQVVAMAWGTTNNIAVTRDRGMTWTLSSGGCDAAGHLQAAPRGGGEWNLAYAGTQWCTTRSLDTGATWANRSDGTPLTWEGAQTGIDSNGMAYKANTQGLLTLSVNNVEAWVEPNQEMGSSAVTSLMKLGGEFYLSTAWGAFKTSDFLNYQTIELEQEDNGFAATASHVFVNATARGWRRYRPQSLTFDVVSPGVDQLHGYAVAAQGTIAAFLSYNGMSVSTDEGITFRVYRTNDGLPSNAVNTALVEAGSIYAGTVGGIALIRPGTLFSGSAVKSITTFPGSTSVDVSSLCFSDGFLYLALDEVTGQGGLYRTDADLNGLTRETRWDAALAGAGVSLVACGSNAMALALTDGRVLVSDVFGSQGVINPALYQIPLELKSAMNSLQFIDGHLYLMTGRGLYRL
jgi:hypothetical protein